MGKFKVGDIVKQKEGVLYPHIKEIDVVVDVGKVFSPSLGKEVDYIELSSHPSIVNEDKFEFVDTYKSIKVDVEFTLEELKKIHTIIGNEIEKVGIYEGNDLMRICKEIKNKTDKYLVWV